MTAGATVAIVTVTYNASAFIERYLESVAGILNERPGTTLYVVDNDSRDDTLQQVESFLGAHGLSGRVVVIATGENLGFGRGCNRGAEEAMKGQVDYLWFLNPDTQPTLGALEAMLDVFREQNAAFVGCQLSDENGVVRTGAFRFPGLLTTFLNEARLGVLDRIFARRTFPVPVEGAPERVDWVTGATFVASRAAFETLGGFDPQYFLYFEEVDLFLRARRLDLEVWSTPRCHIHHISGASTGINKKDGRRAESRAMPRYWYDSRRYFYTKNFGAPYTLAMDLCVGLGRGIGVAKDRLRGRQPEVKDVSRTLLQQNLGALRRSLGSRGR